MRRRLVSFSVILNLIFCVGVKADLQDCSRGWQLFELQQDLWGKPPDFAYTTSGTSMGFWEKPIWCEAITYEDGYKIILQKRLVCVSPSLQKIQDAPEGGDCEIQGKAIPQTGPYSLNSTDPCVTGVYMGGSGYSSDYGEVTITRMVTKYKCNRLDNIIPNKNQGPPDACR